MDLKTLPETIRTNIEQAGGLGLHGAFTYIGASKLTYRCAQSEGEYRSGRPSCLKTEGTSTFVDFEVGLSCKVNGKPGRSWTLIICYEGAEGGLQAQRDAGSEDHAPHHWPGPALPADLRAGGGEEVGQRRPRHSPSAIPGGFFVSAIGVETAARSGANRWRGCLQRPDE